jgi:hypothetical protein
MNDLQTYYLFSSIAGLLILYVIISTGTRSAKILKESTRQSLYLRTMAEKAGVSSAELEAIDKNLDK